MRSWKKGAAELTSRSSFISSLGRDFVKVGLLEKAKIGGYVGIIVFFLACSKIVTKIFTGDLIETIRVLSISKFPFFLSILFILST